MAEEDYSWLSCNACGEKFRNVERLGRHIRTCYLLKKKQTDADVEAHDHDKRLDAGSSTSNLNLMQLLSSARAGRWSAKKKRSKRYEKKDADYSSCFCTTDTDTDTEADDHDKKLDAGDGSMCSSSNLVYLMQSLSKVGADWSTKRKRSASAAADNYINLFKGILNIVKLAISELIQDKNYKDVVEEVLLEVLHSSQDSHSSSTNREAHDLGLNRNKPMKYAAASGIKKNKFLANQKLHVKTGELTDQNYNFQGLDGHSRMKKIKEKVTSSVPKGGYKYHSKPKHIEASTSAIGGSARGGYVCNLCPRSFPTGQALGGHKRCHQAGGAQAPDTLVINEVRQPTSQFSGFDLNETPAPEEECK